MSTVKAEAAAKAAEAVAKAAEDAQRIFELEADLALLEEFRAKEKKEDAARVQRTAQQHRQRSADTRAKGMAAGVKSTYSSSAVAPATDVEVSVAAFVLSRWVSTQSTFCHFSCHSILYVELYWR